MVTTYPYGILKIKGFEMKKHRKMFPDLHNSGAGIMY
jgi:hypothetical protein